MSNFAKLKESVNCIGWNGLTLAAGSADGMLTLFSDWKQEKSIKAHEDSINSLAWSDGHIATGSSDKTVIIWNSELECKMVELKDHTEWVRSVSFSYDGTLATGGEDGVVNVYKFDSLFKVLSRQKIEIEVREG